MQTAALGERICVAHPAQCYQGVCSGALCICNPGWQDDSTLVRMNTCSTPVGATPTACYITIAWGLANLIAIAALRSRSPRPSSVLNLAAALGSVAMAASYLSAGVTNAPYWFFSMLAALAIQLNFVRFLYAFLMSAKMQTKDETMKAQKLVVFLATSTLLLVLPFLGIFIVCLATDVEHAPETLNRAAAIGYLLVPVNVCFNAPISIVYAWRLALLLSSSGNGLSDSRQRAMSRRLKVFALGIALVMTPGIVITGTLIFALYFSGYGGFVWCIWCVLMPCMQYVVSLFIFAGSRSSSLPKGSVALQAAAREDKKRFNKLRNQFGARWRSQRGTTASNLDSQLAAQKSGVTVSTMGGGRDGDSLFDE